MWDTGQLIVAHGLAFQERGMRIEKVINNNVISALDDQGREIVAMGRGIGFQKKSGQEIKAAQVEKIFHLGSPDLQARFQELLANMPMECVQVSDEIISYAKSHLSMQLNQNVYLALTDHIDFALRRFKDGMLFENALYSEIRRFYPEEFQIGCHALDLIEERIGVRLPEDEAASIAFHLVNSEFGGMRLRDAQIMTEIIRHLIGMIRADYHFPEDLVYEDRLITNLKFMLNRLIQNKEGWIAEDARFNEFVRANYKNEYELARAMRDYIESVVSCKMTEEEVIYLAVQLKYADIKKKEGKKNGIF